MWLVGLLAFMVTLGEIAAAPRTRRPMLVSGISHARRRAAEFADLPEQRILEKITYPPGDQLSTSTAA